MKRILWLLLVLCCVGCGGDDDGTTPVDGFDVTFRAVDPLGNPVAGLELGLCSENQFLQDKQAKPAVSIGLETPVGAHVLLTVEDIEGATVRTLVDEDLPDPGAYRVRWIGDDDQGVHQPSGRYTVRMIATVDDAVAFTDTQDMLMCLADSGQYAVGVTDAAGEIVLTDARHFPHLYSTEALMAYDETASERGWIQFDGVMHIDLHDPLTDDRMVFRELVVGDDAVVVLVWDPRRGLIGKPRDKALPPAAAALVPDLEWRLLAPYPNPFN